VTRVGDFFSEPTLEVNRRRENTLRRTEAKGDQYAEDFVSP
jgi:hypothetical protein